MTELISAGGCFNGIRYAEDGSSADTRDWLGAIETSYAVDIANILLVCASFDGDDMNIATDATFKLQWRNVTDAGSWTDLASTGEIRWESSSVTLVNNHQIHADAFADSPSSIDCTGKGWSVLDIGSKEIEGANGITQTVDDDELFDLHWAVDVTTGGDAGDEYEFRVTESGGTVIGTSTGKITLEVAKTITAESRDDDDAIVGSVGVVLLKRTGSFPYTYEQIDSGTTHASLGTHVFSVLGTDWYRILYLKELAPDQWDISDEIQAV